MAYSITKSRFFQGCLGAPVVRDPSFALEATKEHVGCELSVLAL